MKQHPDRQPGRTITVQGGDDDDRRTDQNFESDWIDGVTPISRFNAKGAKAFAKNAT
jgi:hypothetical protein